MYCLTQRRAWCGRASPAGGCPPWLAVREYSALLPHGRADKQERAAQGVLAMFWPCREPAGVLLPAESAVQRHAPGLSASPKGVRIRVNMQHLDESFGRPQIDAKLDAHDPHEGARGEPADEDHGRAGCLCSPTRTTRTPPKLRRSPSWR